MVICILLIFSGFVIHTDEQLLPQIQSFSPIKVLASDLMRASFMGKSKTMELVDWLLDMNTPVNNRTEIFIDCQKKKVLATKLKQVRI